MKKLFIILLSLTFLLVFSCQNPDVDYRPQNFEKTDLVGTWQAVYGNNRTDTLIIREDGTYKQIYTEPNGYSFESSWNQWDVEYRNDGRFYLHLEGMRYYPLERELGEKGGRNLFSEPELFYDPDEDRAIKMLDKVVLRVHRIRMGPGEIALVHMVTDPDMSGDSFFIQK